MNLELPPTDTEQEQFNTFYNEFINSGFPQIKNPFDPAPLCDLFSLFHSKIDLMAIEAKLHGVFDDNSLKKSVEMSAQARQLLNAIAKKQKLVTAPYHQVKSTVDRECKTLKDQLLKIQRVLESKNRPYIMLKEYERREAQKKANKEIEARIKENPDQPVITVTPDLPSETRADSESGYAKLKVEWSWKVEDFRKLPDECLNERMEQIIKAISPWINAQIKAGIRHIPGVKVYEEAKVKTRVK